MRNKLDPELGQKVYNHLRSLKLEPLIRKPNFSGARDALVNGLCEFFDLSGIDGDDPSTADSPARIGDMFIEELCIGLEYANFPKCTVQPNIDGTDEMVMLDSITTISLCEHHFQTIAGLTHIAYIPNEVLLGVSKLPRITNFFARRPQVQERMTAQIHAALRFILGTDDVAVSQSCVHFCVRARGVMDPNSRMTTNKLGGKFMDKPALREEFLHAIPR
jgi:GTP cyclohydrolase I